MKCIIHGSKFDKDCKSCECAKSLKKKKEEKTPSKSQELRNALFGYYENCTNKSVPFDEWRIRQMDIMINKVKGWTAKDKR